MLSEIEDFPATKDQSRVDVVRRLAPFSQTPPEFLHGGAIFRQEARARRRLNGVGESGVAQRSRLQTALQLGAVPIVFVESQYEATI